MRQIFVRIPVNGARRVPLACQCLTIQICSRLGPDCRLGRKPEIKTGTTGFDGRAPCSQTPLRVSLFGDSLRLGAVGTAALNRSMPAALLKRAAGNVGMIVCKRDGVTVLATPDQQVGVPVRRTAVHLQSLANRHLLERALD